MASAGKRPGRKRKGRAHGARSAQGPADPLAAIKREIAQLRESFPGLSEADCQDAVSEAYRQLFEAQVRGEAIPHPDRWLHSAAWRRADDELRKRERRATTSDTEALERLADRAPEAHERMLSRIAVARLIAAVHRLPVEQRVALRAAVEARHLRGQRSRLVAWKRLGWSESTFHYRAGAAAHSAAEAIEGECERFEAWIVGALSARLAGASLDEQQSRDLDRLLASDPKVAALQRELSRAHDVAAATLPPLGVAEAADRSVLERLGAAVDHARERAGSVFGGGETQEVAAAASVAGSGGARGAGAAGAGVLAKVGLAGGAGKAVLACVTGGAAVTACVAAGVLPAPNLPGLGAPEKDGATQPRQTKEQGVESDPEPAPSTLPSQVGNGAPLEAQPSPAPTQGQEAPSRGSAEPAEPVDPVAPSAPAVEREFGVASAAAPLPATDGSSGSSGGGATGSVVRQEFGP